MNRTIQNWIPGSEFTLRVSEAEKRLYKANDPRSVYHAYRWIYQKGRHKGGEFPVVVVRKHFMDQGYRVWVSGQSKLGIDAFILVMFPGLRQNRDQSYLTMIEVFGEKKIDQFITIAEQEKKRYHLPRHGGDPDLFVLNPAKPNDKFFVEVKAEDFSHMRHYKDDLNDQQRLVFPLIEKLLKCQVRLAKVQIFDRVETSVMKQGKKAKEAETCTDENPKPTVQGSSTRQRGI